MSHFVVLVAAADEAELEKKLLPFHEYECTGIEQYTEWVDFHDENFSEYQEGSVECVFRGDERIGTKYSEKPEIKAMWKREGFGISSKDEFVLPDGHSLRETPFTEIYPTFDDYMHDWCGYDDDHKHPETGRWGRKTNPNAKWDWWIIGGRWTGFLKLKPYEIPALPGTVTEPFGFSPGEVKQLVAMCRDEPEKFERVVAKFGQLEGEIKDYITSIRQAARFQNMFKRHPLAKNGEPGLMTEPNEDPERADAAPAFCIDWEGPCAEKREKEMKQYISYHEALDSVGSIGGIDLEGNPIVTEEDAKTIEHYASLVKRSEKWEKLFPTLESFVRHERAVKASGLFEWGYSVDDVAELQQTREQFEASIDDTPAWAFIDSEGKWQEKADMGWWGMSSKDESHNGYPQRFWNWVESLNPNDMVYAVDCHI